MMRKGVDPPYVHSLLIYASFIIKDKEKEKVKRSVYDSEFRPFTERT